MDRQYKWTKENRYSINLGLPKAYKEMLKELSAETNQSITQWIQQAIEERAEAQRGLFFVEHFNKR